LKYSTILSFSYSINQFFN